MSTDAPARPKRFNGLRHLALVVENLEEVEKFYTEIMGMEVMSRVGDRITYLTCGNDNLSLARANEGKDPKGGTLDHFGFVVDSKEELHAWYDYLKAVGADLIDEPHDHQDGARSFHVKDPAGNKVQPLYHPAVSGQKFTGP